MKGITQSNPAVKMANKRRFSDKEIESILLESRIEDSDNSFFPESSENSSNSYDSVTRYECSKCLVALHFPDCFRVIKPLNFLKYQQNHAEQLGCL
ncbi:hypothetical protein C0J52_03829 [Blattella germanica]|nr:hypothetical protein C0J52_03829 [Blattella germanica]